MLAHAERCVPWQRAPPPYSMRVLMRWSRTDFADFSRTPQTFTGDNWHCSAKNYINIGNPTTTYDVTPKPNICEGPATLKKLCRVPIYSHQRSLRAL